ncbi:MAG: adenylate/guanylate cyclase domain-containing protein [Desulfobacterales bacterium]|nr:MAG: adenylate/guanylate cyclase domain-containing protein [Desulfobacterales bacterium]
MSKRSIFGKKSIQGLIVGITGATLALSLWGLGLLDIWEAKTWDWRASVMAKPGKATDDIRLVMLDQNSLDWAEKEMGLTWPWPREIYGAIVNYCQRNGAKALAFDVLFTEPSSYGVDDDAALGNAASEFGRLAGAVFLGKHSGSLTRWPSQIPSPDFKINGLKNWLNHTHSDDMIFPRATMAINELALNSAILSNVRLNPDPDGIYRRVKLFGVFDDKVLPSLGLGVYLAANPKVQIQIEPGKLRIGGKVVHIDRQGNVILRYRGPSGTHKAYSAAAILQSEIRSISGEDPTISDKQAFKDKYVLFGFSAPGLYDLRSAPVGGVYPGVEIQATMLDNFLSIDFMCQAPFMLTVILVIVLALACAASACFFRSAVGSVAVSAMFVVAPVFFALGSYANGFWLPMVVQETAVVFSIAIALVVNYTTEGRQKRFIKSAFKQYLSPNVIEQLIQHPERLKLGGERRILSIFFSDLEGFTSISEGLAPEELTVLLNDYLSAMTNIIQEEGGTVDKYEGDAIIAFWNAPLEVPEHATKAVRAALRCQANLSKMRIGFKKRIGKDMFMRIGINTGPAVVGNLGSHTRFDYTMLGDAVNLAARLEGANKQFGTYTMISQSTRDLLQDALAVRELARVAVVGRKEAVTVYEPMFAEEYEARKDALKTFAKGLASFYKGDFSKALEIFSTIRNLDPAAAAYANKCQMLIGTQPENWLGVWVMTSK